MEKEVTAYAHHLRIFIDERLRSKHRKSVEAWLSAFKAAELQVAGSSGGKDRFEIHLVSEQFLMEVGKPSGFTVMLRPYHQDLLLMNSAANVEELADVILDEDSALFDWLAVVEQAFSGWWNKRIAPTRKQADKNLKLLMRHLKSELKVIPETGQEMIITSSLAYLQAHETLVAHESWDEWERDLETLAKAMDRKKRMRLWRERDLVAKVGDGAIFTAGEFNNERIYLEWRGAAPTGQDQIILYWVLHCFHGRTPDSRFEIVGLRPGLILQDAFQSLAYPVLFLEANGRVLQHNAAYGRLNLAPKEALRLKDQEQVQVKGISYLVRMFEHPGPDSNRIALFFMPVNLDDRPSPSRPEGQDLGIITSSIAHELNNPLAGLLAALEILLLDEWDDESRMQLSEMKQGAGRCKQLVETFLGFSRLDPKLGTGAGSQELLRAAFEQAQSLLRFRMVESGMRLQLESKQGHPYGYPLNGPTVTMILYLVLGEVLTAFSHQRLLERKNSRDQVLLGEVIKEADYFKVIFKQTISIKNGLQSKLLLYLLRQESLQLVAEGKELIFQHQRLLV